LIEVAIPRSRSIAISRPLLCAEPEFSNIGLQNLNDHCIEVYTDPKAGKAPAYRRRQDYRMDEAVL